MLKLLRDHARWAFGVGVFGEVGEVGIAGWGGIFGM